MGQPNLVDEVKRKVKEQIIAQGASGNNELINQIIGEQAAIAAEGNPALSEKAQQIAQNYYSQGIPPEDSAGYAAAQIHQEAVLARPSVDTRADQLLRLRTAEEKDDDAIASAGEVEQFARNNNIPIDSKSKTAISDISEILAETPIDSGDAARAQLAVVNAQSNGSVLPAGLEINGNLTAKVYGAVDLDFKNSHFKTVIGDTTYTHHSDIQIDAENVYLTASTISIEADKEINTVTGNKISRRSDLSASCGLFNIMEVSEVNRAYTALSVDISGVNASGAVSRFGVCAYMKHFGSSRHGVKGFAFGNADYKLNRSEAIHMAVINIFFLLL